MKKLSNVLLMLVLIAFGAETAHAVSSYLNSFNSTYGTSATVLNTCSLCHSASGPPALNAYGSDYGSNGHNFSNIASLDSDSDGFTNLSEITARTFPGNAASKPAPLACTSYSYTLGACQPDGTAAVTGSTGIPAGCSGGAAPATTQPCTYVPPACTSYSYTLGACQPDGTAAVTASTGIPAGCSGGAVPETTQTCTYVPPPVPSACTSYSYTLGACQPDGTAAVTGSTGIPAGCSGGAVPETTQTCTYVPPPVPSADTIRPRITVFNIPRLSTLMTVPVLALNAVDKAGVTGYILKESPVPPEVSDAGWTQTPPSSFTFTKSGVRHLYAWAKDAAGNISKKRSAKVRILIQSTDIPVPTKQRTFIYEPIVSPIGNVKPSAARPLGVGPVAIGGDTVDMEISLNQFSGPVDVYLGLYALSNDVSAKDLHKASKRDKDEDADDDAEEPDDDSGTNEIYLKDELSIEGLPSGPYVPQDISILQTENRLQALVTGQEGIQPWETGVTDISGPVLDSVPSSVFPSGTYVVLLGVTPPNDRDKYYLWVTYFTIK